MDFLKEFPSSDFHPQLRKAGFWGATVFRALCRMSARHDLDGEIPPQYQDPEELADILKADEYGAEIQAGLDRCFGVGLLRKEDLGDGHGDIWIIDGWSSLYTEKHKTNLERREAWKEKKRAQREAYASKATESKECPPLSKMSPGTKNVPLTRHDETRRDETRRDETRRDETLTTLSFVSQTTEEVLKTPTSAEAVFEHWRVRMRKNARTAMDAQRRRLIEARLKDGYSIADLKLAIDGCAADPFSQGQNDRGKTFNDIALICRDAAHVDRFVELASATGPPKPIYVPAPKQKSIEELYPVQPPEGNQ